MMANRRSSSPRRLENWLMVADKLALEMATNTIRKKSRRRRRNRKQYEMPTSKWQSYFCTLEISERKLRHSLTREKIQRRNRSACELRLRLERGRRLITEGMTPSPLTEEDDSELSETTSLRDDRTLLRWLPTSSSDESPKRHTIGYSVLPDLDYCPLPVPLHEQPSEEQSSRAMDTPSSSRLASFFSKRSFKTSALKRTKSVTKLERKRCALDGDIVSSSHLRSSRSHESLLQSSPSLLGTVDLSRGDVQVSTVHNSLLDQDYCFQLTSSEGTTYYSCQTGQERDKWVHSLRKTILPNQNNVRRTEKSLNIWLLEVKGVSEKKRYFCELCLDKTLYARTSSKLKNDLCFWGEHFEFNNLPQLDTITVNLYREADKKKRRDKNILIGSAVISVNSINSHHLTEKWYPILSEKGPSNRESPSVRIKSRFLNISILPLDVYSDFLQYLKTEYKTMCEILEPAVSVRTKEDISTTLIYIMEKENMAKQFLTDIVMADIEKIEDEHLMFRGNSIATKAIEAYMKLMGEKYLQDTLGDIVRSLVTSSDDCEVDPVKVTNNTLLQRHQSNLINYVEIVWNRITASASSFPLELREIFSECRKRLAERNKEELSENLISASVFLRFLCPAILSPSLFNLTQEYPQGKAARKLTLIAKSIQTFANFTRFGGKENFMEFMNEFLEREWSRMKSFLREISSPAPSNTQPQLEFDGYIDEGRELAVLHGLLVDCLDRVSDKNIFDHIEKLQRVLDGVSAALSQPSLLRQMSSPSASVCTAQPSSPTDTLSTCTSHTATSLQPVSPSRSSTLPRTYLLGSNQQPAHDLNTTDDYVLLSALRTDSSPPIHSRQETTSLPSQTRDRDILPNLRYSSPSRVFGGRRIIPSTPNRYSKGTEIHYPRRRLCRHDEENVETSETKMEFSSSTHQHSTLNSVGYESCSPSDSLTRKAGTNSPCLPPPLAFNNPMYQLPGPGFTPTHRHSSHLSSSSSDDSDEDISLIGRPCLGSAESEPVLTLGARYCCTSSSSTDTNSCDSPPPLPESKLKIKCSTINSVPFKSSGRHMLHTSHSTSDTCSFQPRVKPVHRSSTDSGLHKSFRLKGNSQFQDECTSSFIRELKSEDRRRTLRVSPPKNTAQEYEQQVQELRRLMGGLQSKLEEAEIKLTCQEAKTESAITEWRTRMEEEEDRVRRQQEEKDQQMKSIITRLITVEEELRREQREMQELITAKQKVIETQERKIQTLDATNAHLMAVLTQLRGRYCLQGRNGTTPPLKTSFVNRDPLYKSSSC